MNDHRYAGLSAGIFLIGLGLLFLLRIGIWPWILVLIGLAGLPAALATHRGWLGWQGAFWMIGLALLFWSGRFWPGILIMIGLSVLLEGIYRGAERSTSDVAEPSGADQRDQTGPEPFDIDRAPGANRDAGQNERSSGDTRRL